MSHSIIPPSSAHIWGKPDGCTGWVLMAQQYPEPEGTRDTAEGEASHEIGGALVASVMRGGQSGERTPAAFVGNPAQNGTVFTDEMFEAAEMYAGDIIPFIHSTRTYGGNNIGVERRVHAKRVHELSHGTPDFFLYDPDTHTLYIWDYKYGFLLVEAFENWQAINYFAGILDELGISDMDLKVKVRIVQPRGFHRDGPIREWAFMGESIRGHINQLEASAARSLGSNAELRTGSHCRYCQARHACPAALAAGVGLFEIAAKPLPVELSPAAVGVQLSIIKRAIKQLGALESGFEEQVKALIKGGNIVPGWGTEEGVGRERWTQPVAEVIALGKMLERDLQKPEVVTPNQARKLGIDDAVIMAYSEKPKTGLKIVPDNGDNARKVFTP